MPQHQRPSLYSSAIQHILVLQEEQSIPNLSPEQNGESNSHHTNDNVTSQPSSVNHSVPTTVTPSTSSSTSSSAQRRPTQPWHSRIHTSTTVTQNNDATTSNHNDNIDNNNNNSSNNNNNNNNNTSNSNTIKTDAAAATTSNNSVNNSPTKVIPSTQRQRTPWRVTDRIRTRHGLLVLCLRIGYEPPDVVKPNPCARLECWIHPNVDQPDTSLSSIGTALKSQYERWGDRDTTLKLAEDPKITKLKSQCKQLRQHAGDQRLLFHYNGHGVPRPTSSAGEIWVFNSNYSQYIPLNIFDLHEVLGSPVLYIFDCNSAGTVLNHFLKLCVHLDRDWNLDQRRRKNHNTPNNNSNTNNRANNTSSSSNMPPHRHSVFLGACADGQMLPTVPYVPADVFTSCLTTPIKMALRWFARRTLIPNITTAMLDRIPGKYHLRNTPLGDLEYVFTAVSDAIAWNVLPRELFKRLYRQDILLASLMRNFLLAQRILRSFGVTPVSYPELPDTHNHPLWQSFDLAMENLLSQLPMMLAQEDARRRALSTDGIDRGSANSLSSKSSSPIHRFTNASAKPGRRNSLSSNRYSNGQLPTIYDHREDGLHHSYDLDDLSSFVYRPSSFFADQMKAFDVWLDMGPDSRDPPEQLPVMLQVLLSPAWRVKALQLISRYMQTGPVAVDEALSVGVFPYMSQLLKNQQVKERNDLVFIWSKILALDESCRVEIVKSKVDEYFVKFLLPEVQQAQAEPSKPVYLACAMFVLSVVARDEADRCQQIGAIEACTLHLSHENSFVQRWACLCLTEILKRTGSTIQLNALANDRMIELLNDCALHDHAPDVRAAAVSTLTAICNGVLKHVSTNDLSTGQLTDRTSMMDFNGSGPIVVDSTGASSVVRNTSNGLSNLDMNSHDEDVRVSTPPITSIQNTVDSLNAVEASPEDMNVNTMNPFPALNHPNLDIDNDFLYAIPLPYSKEESDALLKIGKVLASIARNESSVVVRREVANAVAELALIQQDRFNRAAMFSEWRKYSENLGESSSLTTSINFNDGGTVAQCEEVYQKLWQTLAELAFDPHPIDAAIARRSYDKIYEVVIDRCAPCRSVSQEQFNPLGHDDNVNNDGDDDISGDHGGSGGTNGPQESLFSQSSRPSSDFLLPSSRAGDAGDVDGSSAITPDGLAGVPLHSDWRDVDTAATAISLGGDGNENIGRMGGVRSHPSVLDRSMMKENLIESVHVSSPRNRPTTPLGKANLPPHPTVIRDRPKSSALNNLAFRTRALGESPPGIIPGGSVHVRSSSGSFDLNMPSRLPMTATAVGGSRLDVAMMEPVPGRRRRTGWSNAQRADEDTLSEPGQQLQGLNEDEDEDEDRPDCVSRLQAVQQSGEFIRSYSPPWFKKIPSNGENRPNSLLSDSANEVSAAELKKSQGLERANTAITINRGALPTFPKSTSTFSGLRLRSTWDEGDVKAISPPRPPKRTHSYSVLNAASTLASLNRSPLFPPKKPTSYFPVTASIGMRTGSNDGKLVPAVPAGYNQLHQSEKGNAAQSLYEWSRAYISRAEVEESSLDDSKEEDALPRYATLWNNISKKDGSLSLAEKLRQFALLGKGDEIIGMEEANESLLSILGNNYSLDHDDGIKEEEEGEEGSNLCPGSNLESEGEHVDTANRRKAIGMRINTKNEFSKAKELALKPMAAGGGYLSALAFLPHDLGIGDDQLVATGDTNGAVGVYDARTGKCQGAFGIPTVPGVEEFGISSILCLNPHDARVTNTHTRTSSSHSSLILAGSFDGRVAVFKNDFSRPNDFRIMSTFQASGRTPLGKIFPSSKSNNNIDFHPNPNSSYDNDSNSNMILTSPQNIINSSMNDVFNNSGIENLNSEDEDDELLSQYSYSGALKKYGKGLVLAFNPDSAYLAAGGLDSEVVRVWDLDVEQCTWQGPCLQKGSRPTAVTMWKRNNPHLFVVGSSEGVVRLVDMREKASLSSNYVFNSSHGKHEEPIVSLGTCVDRDAFGMTSNQEIVVSADYGGEIVFWDARWTSNRNNNKRDNSSSKQRENVPAPRDEQSKQQELNEEFMNELSLEDNGNEYDDDREDKYIIRHDDDEYEYDNEDDYDNDDNINNNNNDRRGLELVDRKRIKAHESSLRTMCIHQNGRYIASGSFHGVKIFGRDRTMMKMISHSESTMMNEEKKEYERERLSPVTALAFQQETSLLAIGCHNGKVMIYGKERDLHPNIRSES